MIAPKMTQNWLGTAVARLGGTLAISVSLISPVAAHTIKTGGDVAVTFHIDPDHNPKAGDTATAWFAMTRRGGKSIPLQQCHCKLAVYLDSEGQDLVQTMSTSLKSISREDKTNIPASDLIFPRAGIYKLEFSGTPKQQGDFKPFRLTYSVTVIPGQAASSQVPTADSSPTATKSPNSDRNSIFPALLSVAGGGAVLGAISSIFYRQRRHKQISDAVKPNHKA